MAVDSAKNVSSKEGEGVMSLWVPPSSRVAMEEIRAVAKKFADEPLQCTEQGVWGVLTAISIRARQRQQGMNIRFSLDEHTIGRCVEDSRFKINCPLISSSHCRIYRDMGRDSESSMDGKIQPSIVASEDPGSNIRKVFVKDTRFGT